MSRLFSFLGALAFGLAISGTGIAQAASSPSPAASAKSSAMSSKKCAAGTTWVKGYTKKDGTKVKGYCRKG